MAEKDKVKEVEKAESTMASEEADPCVKRPLFNTAYVTCFRLKTVAIEPFTAELFQDASVRSWLAQALEFDIRKSRSGKSMAVMHFETEDVGEAAFMDLTETLGKDIKVEHPFASSSNTCSCHDIIENALDMKRQDDQSPYIRQVILEGVPESTPLDKISEIFPDARNILDFRDDPVSRGILTFEVDSLGLLTELIEAHFDLKIDGQPVKIGKYANKANKWNRKDVKKIKRDRENIKALSDEERVKLCQTFKEYKDEVNAVFNRTDIFSQEKKSETMRLNKLMKPLQEQLNIDTQRRMNKGETKFPEPDEITPNFVKMYLEIKERNEAKPANSKPSAPVRHDFSMEATEDLMSKRAEREALLEKARRQAAERNQKATQALMLRANADKLMAFKQPRGRGGMMNRGRGNARGGSMRGGSVRGNAARASSAPTNRARGGSLLGGLRGRGGPVHRGHAPLGPSLGGPMFGRNVPDLGGPEIGRRRGFDGPSGGFSFGGDHMGPGMNDDFYHDDFEPMPKRMRHGGGNFGRGFEPHMGMDSGPGPIEERIHRLERMQMAAFEVQSRMLDVAASRF